jgi:hypothetical protein
LCYFSLASLSAARTALRNNEILSLGVIGMNLQWKPWRHTRCAVSRSALRPLLLAAIGTALALPGVLGAENKNRSWEFVPPPATAQMTGDAPLHQVVGQQRSGPTTAPASVT